MAAESIIQLAQYDLDLNAIPKGRPRLGRRGRTFTPERTRDFQEAVRQQVREQRIGQGLPVLQGPLGAAVAFNMHPYRGDVDNLQKSLFDGANLEAWMDDGQLEWVLAVKRRAKHPSIIFKIFQGDAFYELFGDII